MGATLWVSFESVSVASGNVTAAADSGLSLPIHLLPSCATFSSRFISARRSPTRSSMGRSLSCQGKGNWSREDRDCDVIGESLLAGSSRLHSKVSDGFDSCPRPYRQQRRR